MWSYLGIFRDQRWGTTGTGKEVCDLLVVFENHILIFSDKECAFGSSGDLVRDWSRWYRRAVKNSADQVWGAERWILEHPDRLFLDIECTQPFPIALPNSNQVQFHRIVVAHGASQRCKEYFGGSGSLMIRPDIVGSAHVLSQSDGGVPFTIGVIDTKKGYIHVLDDTSLDILMRELDTISDFVDYLAKKEQLIASGRLLAATGEEDLLGYFLDSSDQDYKHFFDIPEDVDAIFVDESNWLGFVSSDRYASRRQANQVSYLWDGLIEKFSYHIVNGTQHWSSHSGVYEGEFLLRFLAREPRLRRRMLSQNLLDLIHKTPTTRNMRASRHLLPQNAGEPLYVFLLLSHPHEVEYEEYRRVRRNLLSQYCSILKARYPAVMDIVGIATEPGWKEERSEDCIYFDARHFTDLDRRDAEAFAQEFGILAKIQRGYGMIREYPVRLSSNEGKMKGRLRNGPCPCGSGRKFKYCCGRTIRAHV